jgi:hypothetical protein
MTIFRLTSDSGKLDLDLAKLQRALPSAMRVDVRPDGTYVEVGVESEREVTAQHLMDRELDRLFFLTCVRLSAVECTTTAAKTLTGRWRVHAKLPESIGPQQWTETLTLQLRLWTVASDEDDPLVKILLLYQIIELSGRESPTYDDAASPPHPLTECRLLRHLVAHAGQAKPEVRRYCEHLGLRHTLGNRADPELVRILTTKVPMLEREAKKVLEEVVP